MADDRRGRILQFARDFLKANLLEGDSEIGEMLELEPSPWQGQPPKSTQPSHLRRPWTSTRSGARTKPSGAT